MGSILGPLLFTIFMNNMDEALLQTDGTSSFSLLCPFNFAVIGNKNNKHELSVNINNTHYKRVADYRPTVTQCQQNEVN